MAIIPIDNLIPNRNRTASIPICESFCTEIPEKYRSIGHFLREN